MPPPPAERRGFGAAALARSFSIGLSIGLVGGAAAGFTSAQALYSDARQRDQAIFVFFAHSRRLAARTFFARAGCARTALTRAPTRPAQVRKMAKFVGGALGVTFLLTAPSYMLGRLRRN